MADGKVTIETGLDLGGVKSGLKKLGNVAKTGIGATTKIIAGASAALTGMGGYALKVGSDFEAGMSEVQAISGAAGKDLEALKDKAKEMGATTKFSATESAEALKYMAMAGWKTQQMTAGLPGIMNLAAASGESLASVSDIVTDALTAFNLKAEDSAHFADVLAKASSNSNTNVGMMGATFKYVAPIAGAMKYSIEDTAVAIGLMANAGIKGEQAGTSLRAMLTRLVKPPKDAAAALKKLGISAQNQDGTMKPLSETLSQLREKFAGLDDSQKAEYAASIAGQEAMSGLLAIVNASPEDYAKLTAAIGDSEGAAKDMADTMNNNLQGQITILKSGLEGLGIEIYENIDNPLTDAAKSAIKSVDSITKAFKKNGFEGLAEQAGTVLADAATNIAKVAPDMIKAGAKTVKSFAKGIKKNKKQIATAGGEIVEALADGVSELLPKDLGNAFKNIAKAAVTVAKPVLKVADAIATVAAKCSGAIPIIAGVGVAFKVSSFMDNFVSALKLIKVGQEATTKSTIANTLATKLNTASVKASSVSKTYHAAVEKTLEAATTASTLKTGTYTVAQQASAAASGVAAVATKGFSAALSMMGGPIGLAVTAVGLLAGAALAFSSDSDKATSAAEKQAKKVKELSDAYKEAKKSREESFADTEAEAEVASDLTNKITALAKKTKKTADEKARLKSYVAQLNDLMPELGLKYDEENDKLNKNTEKLYANVEALKAQTRAKAAQELALEATKDQIKAEKDLAEAQRQQADAQRKKDEAQAAYDKKKFANPRGAASTQEYSDLVKAKDDLQEYDAVVAGTKDRLNSAKEEVKAYGKAAADSINWESAIKSTDTFVALMKESGLNVSKKLAEGIRAGKYGVVKSVEDVQNVGTFSKLSKKMGDGGKKGVKALTKQLKSGKLEPKKAVDEMQALIQFNELYKGADKGGKEALKALKKGIESGKTLPSKAMEQVTEAANKKGAAKGKEAKKIGEAIDSGAASGINTKLINATAKMAREALEAAKKEIDSHSPSRKFRDQVGKMMVAGVVQGIKDEKSKLIASVTSLINSTISAAKKAGGNFESIGTSFTDSFTSKVNSRQDAQITSMKNYLDKKQDSIKKADEKEERALQKKIDKSSGSQKKAYQRQLKALKKKHKEEQSASKKAASKILSAYTNALKSESKKLIAQAEKNIEEVSKKYQEKYDELIQKRDSMKEKLMDVGDLITTKTGNLSGLNGVNSGSPMAALSRNVKALEKYQKNITAIKGKIPDDLMEEILKMGVPDANAYMNKLLKMEDSKFTEYVGKWKSEQATVKALEDKYLNTNTLGNLQTDIDQIKQYQANLNNLKGRVPQSLIEEILGMGIDDANAYMQQLNSLSNTGFNNYVAQWKQKEALANSISNEFFAADIKSIQTNYSNAINSEMGKLKTQMNNLGKNVGKAFAKGLKSQSKKSKKAIKDICNTVIKQCKKSLGIKSPSRVFKEIGKLSMVGAEVGTEKEAKILYKKTDQVAQTFAERFAAANLDTGAIYAKMQAAVMAEQSKIPASVQTQIIKMQAQQPERSEQRVVYEIHVHSDIDGREAAKAMATFTDEELGKIAKRKERR